MNKCKICNSPLHKGLYENKVINFCKECGYGIPEKEMIIDMTNCKDCKKWFFKLQENVCDCKKIEWYK